MKRKNVFAIIIAIITLSLQNSIAQSNALNFDGINDYIDIDNAGNTLGNNSIFTVEFWMKSPEVTEGQPAMFAINKTPMPGLEINGLLLLIKPGGALVIHDLANEYVTESIIADNTCHHIAYTRIESMASIYVDGQLILSIENLDFAPSSFDNFSIGQEYDKDNLTGTSLVPSDFYTGDIDEFRYWSIARTEQEIQDNMNNLLTGNESNLEIYYNFNEGVANANNSIITSVTNSASNQNTTGLLNNFTLEQDTSNYVTSACQSEIDPNAVLNFDGINDYVNLDALSSTLANNSSFSIEFLMRYNGPSDVDVPPALFAINNSTHDWNGLLFLVNPDGTLRLDDHIPDNTNSSNTYYSTTVIDDGQCHYISYTTDGSNASLYIDGVFQFNFVPAYTFNATDKISLGQEWDGFSGGINAGVTSNFFNGDMDRIRIWNTSKTHNEILLNLDQELTGGETGLVAFYNCNQGVAGSDNTAITNLENSSSTPGLDGALNNFDLIGLSTNFINNSCIPGSNAVLNFDGNNDYVNLDALSSTFANNNSFSIEFLMKYNGPSDIDVPPALFAINNSTHDWNGLLFLVNPDGTLRLDDHIPDNTNSSNSYYSTTVIDDGQCHYISYTTNGANSSLYIDGIFQFNFAPTYTFNAADKISLGQEWDGISGGINAGVTSNFFNGDMDRIRIWNTTRTHNEILLNLDQELTGGETGLVAFYNCNQGSPGLDNTMITNLTNSSPTIGLDGTLQNLTLNGPSSNFIYNSCEPAPNAVLNFDGTNDYVNLDVLSSTFASNNSFSIEFLMKYNGPSDVDVPPALFAINNSTHDWNGLLFLVNTDGTLRLDDHIPDNTNSSNTYYSNTVIDDGQCHYISYTTDGLIASLYIDGVLQFDFTPTYTFNATDKISLGQEWDGFSGGINAGVTSNFFNGDMDRIRIWNTVRTASEVLQNLNQELTGGENGLIALYNCNQGIAGADNTSIFELTNVSPTIGINGTLQNLTLNGSSSNFIDNSCEIIDSGVGLFENNISETSNSDLLIFPNPANSVINMNIVSLGNNETILIYDVTGQLVSNYELTDKSNGISINIENLEVGLYFIAITNSSTGTVKKGKFVKID